MEGVMEEEVGLVKNYAHLNISRFTLTTLVNNYISLISDYIHESSLCTCCCYYINVRNTLQLVTL